MTDLPSVGQDGGRSEAVLAAGSVSGHRAVIDTAAARRMHVMVAKSPGTPVIPA